MVYADDVRSLPPSKDPTASVGVIGLHPPTGVVTQLVEGGH